MSELLLRLARIDVTRALAWMAVLEANMPNLETEPSRLQGITPLTPYNNPSHAEAAAFKVSGRWHVIVDDRPEFHPVIEFVLYDTPQGDARAVRLNSFKWRTFTVAAWATDPSNLDNSRLNETTPLSFETHRDLAESLQSPHIGDRRQLESLIAAEAGVRIRAQAAAEAEALAAMERQLAEDRAAAERSRQAMLELFVTTSREEERAERERLETLRREELALRRALVGLLPAPRLVKSAAAAEDYAAEVLRALGYLDADPTPPGPDGGVDVVGSHVVAQVKMEAVRTGSPAVQALFGIASLAQKQPFFFSLAGYATQALEFAERAQIACFEFELDGSISARSKASEAILLRLAHQDE